MLIMTAISDDALRLLPALSKKFIELHREEAVLVFQEVFDNDSRCVELTDGFVRSLGEFSDQVNALLARVELEKKEFLNTPLPLKVNPEDVN